MSEQIEDRPEQEPQVEEVPQQPPPKQYGTNESSPSSSSLSSPDESEMTNSQNEENKNKDLKDRSFVKLQPTKEQLQAELEGKRIDPNKDYVSPEKRKRFREQVAEQLVQVAVDKPDWARYNVYQPDWFAFEAELQEMILTMLEPAMKKIYDNEIQVTQANQSYNMVKRRLDEMDYCYQKVTQNIGEQQDMRNNLEMNTTRLICMQKELTTQLERFDDMKDKMDEKFKFLKSDRTTILKNIDNIMHSVSLYRSDTEKHTTRLTKETQKKLQEVNRITLATQSETNRIHDELYQCRSLLDTTIEKDLRQLHSREEINRHNIEDLDKECKRLEQVKTDLSQYSLKTDWLEQQITWCKDSFQTAEKRLTTLEVWRADELPEETQHQIGLALMKTLGDRRKFNDRINSLMDEFAEVRAQMQSNSSEQVNSQEDAEEDDQEEYEEYDVEVEVEEEVDEIQDQNQEQEQTANTITPITLSQPISPKTVKIAQASKSPQTAKSPESTGLARTKTSPKVVKINEPTNDQIQGVKSQFKKTLKKRVLKKKVKPAAQKTSHLARKISDVQPEALDSDDSDASQNRTGAQISNAFDNTPWLQALAKLEARINDGEMKKDARIYCRTFRNRFRDPTKIVRLGTYKDQVEDEGQKPQFKRTHRSKFSKLTRMAARTTTREAVWYGCSDYTRLAQSYLQERITYAGINRLTMPELIRRRKKLTYKEDLLEYKQKKLEKKMAEAALKEARMNMGNGPQGNGADSEKSFNDGQPMKMVTSVKSVSSYDDNEAHTLSLRKSNTGVKRQGTGVKSPLGRRGTVKSRGTTSRGKSSGYGGTPSEYEASSQDEYPKSRTDASQLEEYDSDEDSSAKRKRKKKAKSLKASSVSSPKRISSSSGSSSSSSSSSSPTPTPTPMTPTIASSLRLRNEYAKAMKKHTAKTWLRKRLPSRLSSLDVESEDNINDSTADVPDLSQSSNSIKTEKISCSDDSDDYYGIEDYDSMDEEVLFTKIKDELDDHTRLIRDNNNLTRELASHLRATERAIGEQFDSKLITLKNVFTDELTRLHNISAKEDLKLYELVIWVKEKMYHLSEGLDARLSSLSAKVQANLREFERTRNQHNDLLDRNNEKINGMIGQNDYFTKIVDHLVKITDLNTLLVQADEMDKGTMSLVALKDDQEVKSSSMSQSRLPQMPSVQGQPPTNRPLTSSQHVMSQEFASPPSVGSLSPVMSDQKVKMPIHDGTTAGRTVDNKPFVSINKKCFNCSGQPGKVLEAFKMCCITYFPSKITYKKRKQTRLDLLGYQKQYVNSMIKLNKERNLPIVHAREDLPDYVEYPDKFKENTENELIKNKKPEELNEPIPLEEDDELSETLMLNEDSESGSPTGSPKNKKRKNNKTPTTDSRPGSKLSKIPEKKRKDGISNKQFRSQNQRVSVAMRAIGKSRASKQDDGSESARQKNALKGLMMKDDRTAASQVQASNRPFSDAQMSAGGPMSQGEPGLNPLNAPQALRAQLGQEQESMDKISHKQSRTPINLTEMDKQSKTKHIDEGYEGMLGAGSKYRFDPDEVSDKTLKKSQSFLNQKLVNSGSAVRKLRILANQDSVQQLESNKGSSFLPQITSPNGAQFDASRNAGFSSTSFAELRRSQQSSQARELSAGKQRRSMSNFSKEARFKDL